MGKAVFEKLIDQQVTVALEISGGKYRGYVHEVTETVLTLSARMGGYGQKTFVAVGTIAVVMTDA